MDCAPNFNSLSFTLPVYKMRTVNLAHSIIVSLGTFLHLLNTGGLICRWKQITLCGLTGAN